NLDLMMSQLDGMGSTLGGVAALVRKVDNLADTVDRHGGLFETIQADLAALQKKLSDSYNESSAGGNVAMPKFYSLQCAYSVVFQSAEQAKDFIALTRLNDSGMTWKDPRNGESKLLRARPDQTMGVRRKQKEVEKRTRWSEGCRLGANGPRGILFAASADDAWDFFALQEAPGETSSIAPNVANLPEWGIGIGMANEITTAATST
ncbi:unnamed protein product, partial [Prorocentrum cordatum]